MASWILWLAACRQAEVVDVCERDGPHDPADTGAFPTCLPCADDAECVFGGNPCTDVVYCAHRDDVIPVVELGCSKALERAWPPDEDCLCVDSECHPRP